MKFKFLFLVISFSYSIVFSQENNTPKKWLRIGVVYGFSSQNTYLPQDSDYAYSSTIFKISSHFNIAKKKKHSWEILVEPSYYRSNHESFNYWHAFFTKHAEDGMLRDKYMPFKTMNEYVLNMGIIYRYYLNLKSSIYVAGNSGPMYIDTDTERLKKGFAFSDVFSLGYNYKINKISVDAKCMIRHVSNLNFQYPNYGYNAVGFELGTYYEFN